MQTRKRERESVILGHQFKVCFVVHLVVSCKRGCRLFLLLSHQHVLVELNQHYLPTVHCCMNRV